MQNIYVRLADQIVTNNSQKTYNELQILVNDVSHLQAIMGSLCLSDNLLFVFTSVLSKSILNGEFSTVKETCSEENISSLSENQHERLKIYGDVIKRIFEIVMTQNKPVHIVRSCLNLISVSLKSVFESSSNVAYLQGCLQEMLPGFSSNEQFSSSYQAQLIVLPLRQELQITPSYPYALAIFKSLLEYVTTSSYYKSYYDYRRNIYTFRNSYLAILLNVVIDYSKLLLHSWRADPANTHLLQYLRETILLLETLVMYPFTLNLHEYENDEQTGDTANAAGEIYFPSYFRHILCDLDYNQSLLLYFRYLLGEHDTIDPIRVELYALVSVFSRFARASAYCFNCEDQRKKSRLITIGIVRQLVSNSKFGDSYYLNAICLMLLKIITSYSPSDFGTSKSDIIDIVLQFASNLVQYSNIKIEDGKRNPFQRAFELVAACLEDVKNGQEETFVKQAAQNVLEKGLSRLINNEQTERIVHDFTRNSKIEIECFTDLYEGILPVFQVDLTKNLEMFEKLQLEQLSPSSQTCWLHLCAILLPNHQANSEQTRLILKYFDWAKSCKSIACLRYIHTLMEQMMAEFHDGEPSTCLWRFIEQQTQESFEKFVLGVIKLCMGNFCVEDQLIIDDSLELFKLIYSMLKKDDSPSFACFYDVVKQLLSNLHSTVFVRPKFFRKRVAFFNVISLIWISADHIGYIYDIYGLILTASKEHPSFDTLLRYFHDLTGIIEPIENYKSFKIVVELALQDLQPLLDTYLGSPTQRQAFFANESFLKAFCKLMLAMTTDSSRRISYDCNTAVPLRIHELFRPYIRSILEENYNYPNSLISVLAKLPSLNPLSELIPLQKSMKGKNDYTNLIREYFQNVHLVQDVLNMYDYIQGNIDYMADWWEEIINRSLLPNKSLQEVVDARLCSTRRHKEVLAKLIYHLGKYHAKYWDIAKFKNEREFVNDFLEKYV